jgi:hypothetical protein
MQHLLSMRLVYGTQSNNICLLYNPQFALKCLQKKNFYVYIRNYLNKRITRNMLKYILLAVLVLETHLVAIGNLETRFVASFALAYWVRQF